MPRCLLAARRLGKIGPERQGGEARPRRTKHKHPGKPSVLMDPLRIALLHLAPRAADLAYNQQLVEQGITVAAKAGAKWIVTPELATTGYSFAEIIGTDWIAIQPDAWLQQMCDMARRHEVAILIGHVERDQDRNTLHNSVFTIAANGELLRQHRKINTLRIGSEAWSTPGVVRRG